MRKLFLQQRGRLIDRHSQQLERELGVGLPLGDAGPQQRGAREWRDLRARFAQEFFGSRYVTALHGEHGKLAEIVRGDRARRGGPCALELAEGVERLLPLVLPFVDAAQRRERTRPQPRHLADLMQ
jgi:hypothetical protein